ncbi:nucleotidyltransferase family protein [Rhodospirillum rubrum]|uniref:ISSo9, nucleotidyltransferase domain protein n=1 Tax=Rhodospirillum rubrum (strain ATCC 11170 / ATH 1.1.1 / DSM 467 / LMG 4362 / NCIMB 8255 / S1) TaxID=269796 RepID=Q2RU82_RHORT|nr:nucleotidyltransferase [Rhodospirillum rubrum]ABC22313.1 ISSo9, nucleotidyltransferase domain protein [Rhodospirillum rubrum ATCC 11170]AEO48032.1 ISSo9, nucleotidyltransferase domain-containing protein [Rhodospirillum rubrum F11]MBK5953881.1 nucleotidyltransferase [Rhodospirillum rubrum]QXG81955.1 nucleotidyltransferase [Rhodospirillum rubrum]HAQ00941.1 nucleotidyltransferase [Rhodospirillum rubrum]
MRPSEIVACHRVSLLDVTSRYGLSNVRRFDSVALGEDLDGSDIGLLADTAQGTSLMTLARTRRKAEELTGIQIDIHMLSSIHERYRSAVLKDAKPL